VRPEKPRSRRGQQARDHHDPHFTLHNFVQLKNSLIPARRPTATPFTAKLDFSGFRPKIAKLV